MQSLYDAITENKDTDAVYTNRILTDLDAALRDPYFPSFRHAITSFVQHAIARLGPTVHVGDQLLAYLAINREADIIASLDECTLARTICFLDYLSNTWQTMPYIAMCLRHHNDGPARRILPRLGLLSYDTLHAVLEATNEENAATVVASMDKANTDNIVCYMSQRHDTSSNTTRAILDAIALPRPATPPSQLHKARIVYAIPSGSSPQSKSQSHP